jgi:acyl-CoA synthetase (AMP-forming)/AMP-acid ligase II
MFNNIAECIPHNARRRPAHAALVEGTRTITYHEIDEQIRRMAAHLREEGVTSGHLVGVALRDTSTHVVALFAIARLGAVILPMDCRWTATEKAQAAAAFDTRLVLEEPAAGQIEGVRTLTVDDKWRRRAPIDATEPVHATSADDPLMLALTSGTTGTTKGPLLTHRQLQLRFVKHAVSLTFNEHDRHMVATPMHFGGGRIFTMAHLWLGATIILFPPPYKGHELVAAVGAHRATTLFLVPTLLRRVLELPSEDAPLLGSLRLLISGGAPLRHDERIDTVRRVTPYFVNYYSSTEGGPTALLQSHDEAGEGCVGRPVFLTDVEVVDDRDVRLPPGQVGHVRFRGPGVATGYYENPEQTALAFRDGWFYPGDLGYLDGGGALYLVGRSKDMILRGGVNIYPSEIESTLARHPAVADVAVVGWASREFGEDIAAFVVPKAAVTESELISACRTHLAPYKVPRAIFFVDALPRTTAGKVLKAKLVETLPESRH